ncbi:MAG: hypothetical protein HRU33_12375 [Rhodobacteraceae bacterium]|nr:hypothetical protein [Paracoccaceae bacterium]
MAFLLVNTAVRADYLNTNGSESAPNFVEIRVLEDRVRISVEIDLGEYSKFFDTEASKEASSRSDVLDVVGSTRNFNVLDADGKKLEPKVTAIEIRSRMERPAPTRPVGMPPPPNFGPLSPDVIFLEIDYPFVGQPDELTFVPPTTPADRVVAAIGFLSWHGSVAITNYRFFSAPETLKLNWEDPWYSAYSNKNLRRHNYSPVSSFLSMEARETRHEVIFRLADLESWVDLELGDKTRLSVKDIETVKAKAAAFLRESNPVTIDGVKVAPHKIRIIQLSLGLKGWNMLDTAKAIDRDAAFFGAILSYPQDDLPGRVEVKLDVFSEKGSMIPVVETDPVGSALDAATVDSPVVGWKNSLKKWINPKVSEVEGIVNANFAVPVLSILFLLMGVVASAKAFRSGPGRRFAWGLPSLVLFALAYPATSVSYSVSFPGSAKLDMITAEKIVSQVVHNMAVSQLEVLPERFIASLGLYVAMEDVEEVGAEIRRGLSVNLPSGALAQTDSIQEIKIEEVSATGTRNESRLLASWTTHVSGGHWGHQHLRAIEYRALLDVVLREGSWKLTGLTILEGRTPDKPSAANSNS